MEHNRLILHHYESSPYAEKIRLLLGRGDVPWYSVLSPAMPPRPNIDPLTGGYRRIPVAQLGADIFCDSALIAQEIAALAGLNILQASGMDPAVVSLVKRAEGEVFFSAITGTSPLVVLRTLLRIFGPIGTVKFMRDRSGMMKKASVKPPRGTAAIKVFNKFLSDLDHALSGKVYLSGDRPAYADFAVFHPIWLQVMVSGQPVDDAYPNVQSWFNQVADSGHGPREELEAIHAFAIAEQSNPRALPESETHPLLNRKVAIGPSDYGQNPVHGELVAVTPERFVTSRVTDRFGVVNVHFPREGYSVVEL